MGRFLLLLILIGFPLWANAGAWPRGKANLYVDLAFFAYPQDHETRGFTPHLYLEYGINKKLTFALDGIYRKEHSMFTGVASVLYALPENGRKYRLSFGMGYGRAVYQYQTTDELYDLRAFSRILIAQTVTTHTKPQTVSQYSAHFGTSSGPHWFTADAYMRRFHTSNLVSYKFDVTYGFHATKRLSTMMQMQYGTSENLEYLNIAPTINWRLGKKMSVAIGLSYDTISGYQAAKLGTIFEF